MRMLNSLLFCLLLITNVCAQTLNDGGIVPVSRGGTGGTYYPGSLIAGVLKGANLNTTADQPITFLLPAGVTKYVINGTLVTNPSVSLTTAVGGIYDAPSKGGGTIVSATQAYSGLVLSTDVLSATNGTHSTSFANTVTTVYLSLTTPQGSAATADFYIIVRPFP